MYDNFTIYIYIQNKLTFCVKSIAWIKNRQLQAGNKELHRKLCNLNHRTFFSKPLRPNLAELKCTIYAYNQYINLDI